LDLPRLSVHWLDHVLSPYTEHQTTSKKAASKVP
jgi:hypothetical protein